MSAPRDDDDGPRMPWQQANELDDGMPWDGSTNYAWQNGIADRVESGMRDAIERSGSPVEQFKADLAEMRERIMQPLTPEERDRLGWITEMMMNELLYGSPVPGIPIKGISPIHSQGDGSLPDVRLSDLVLVAEQAIGFSLGVAAKLRVSAFDYMALLAEARVLSNDENINTITHLCGLEIERSALLAEGIVVAVDGHGRTIAVYRLDY